MKIGILGTGRISQIHAEAIWQIGPDLIGGAWNRTPEKAQDFCAKFGGTVFATSDDLLASSDIDAVLITTNTSTHFELAKASLAAGKHVLLEKPICETSDQIRQLISLAKASGKICMPSHNYLYAEDLRRLHHHAQCGHLGQILNFWVMFSNFHPASYGMTGTYMMRELFVHHIYVLLYMMGRPNMVSAVGTNMHFEDPTAIDQMHISATYDDGCIANLWGSFAAEDHTREPWSYLVKVMGSEGSGIASWDKIKYGSQTEPLWDDGGYWDSFLFAERFFIENCLIKGEEPLSTLEDALDAATIFEAAIGSLETKQQVHIDYMR